EDRKGEYQGLNAALTGVVMTFAPAVVTALVGGPAVGRRRRCRWPRTPRSRTLRDAGRIAAGQRVLVNGAPATLAKAFGPETTGVCGARDAALVRSLGADDVVDHTREDFNRAGERYDLLVDVMGDRSPAGLRRPLTPRGTFVIVGGISSACTSPARRRRRFAGRWPPLRPLEPNSADPRLPAGPMEEERLAPRHRPDLHVCRDPRGAAPCRAGPRPRRGRHHPLIARP
ncbi:zinc-binding dehydrogenase, partial [Actinomadura kijaniata]|uniref:zinc-binding dehydrogenase n=1 Tax=Actinomadura kijaniata TaxID=46161 RepID=UPI003F1B2BC8